MDKHTHVCDKLDCKTENYVERFSIFLERKADQAGGMEDWYAQFDLCHHHAIELLNELLSDQRLGTKVANVPGWLSNRNIVYRKV